MRVLEKMKPEALFRFFEDICSIPHGSGDTGRISDYCVQFARERGLWCHRDGLNNVIIKKPASKGYEGHAPVIIQGHLDMVCEKAADCDLDFTKDPLRLRIDGDFISAEGTTLGGDDGIAIAAALCVLDDPTLSHPPIEAVFTVDEETGMYGAEGLDCSLLSGRMLINIDSEEEGILTVSCAGGARAECSLPLCRTPLSEECVRITVEGLIGGHSGVEIDKGRLNANRVMAEFLRGCGDFRIVSIDGGLKDNAIPVRCVCVAALPQGVTADGFVKTHAPVTDPNLSVTLAPAGIAQEAFTAEASQKAVEFLLSLPNGVQAMSRNVAGLVETSLNLGILQTTDSGICASFAVRSSVGEEKQRLLAKMEEITLSFGGEFESHGHYPAWEYKEKSRLRDTFVAVSQRVFGKTPEIAIIHAGLECGLFSEKMPGLDAVSIGPDMADIHTPRERLSISSAARTYHYLCEILKEL